MSRLVEFVCVVLYFGGFRLIRDADESLVPFARLQFCDVVPLLLRLGRPCPLTLAIRFCNDSVTFVKIISRAPTFGLSAIPVRILQPVRNASFPIAFSVTLPKYLAPDRSIGLNCSI